MHRAAVRALVDQVARGELDPDEATERLAMAPVLDLGFARLDANRALRQGEPETILADGKTPAQVEAIVRELVARGTDHILVTRAGEEIRAAVLAAAPGAQQDPVARAAWVARDGPEPRGAVVLVSAGTADGPALHEAAVTARLFGAHVRIQEDVGVAGLHRLALVLPDLREADCVVVAAGHDAALASVVSGLVAAPVIGLPTSTGYGAAAGGVSALLAMLASCSPGVAVVNIDDGFGAGTIAARIARAAAAGEPA